MFSVLPISTYTWQREKEGTDGHDPREKEGTKRKDWKRVYMWA